VSKLTTDVVTYCTEASNQKSKYAYRKIFFYKKALAVTKKSCRSKMPYMISSRSVTDGISLSVSKSKLVYNSLIFVDNKFTLICLLTQQQ